MNTNDNPAANLKVLEDLVAAARDQIKSEVLDRFIEMATCDGIDSAIESLIDYSGGGHMWRIPESLFPGIENWANSLPDSIRNSDDGYLEFAIKRAIDYGSLALA